MQEALLSLTMLLLLPPLLLLLLLFPRYVHEADVPTNLETQEALMDWALDRMGLAEGERGMRSDSPSLYQTK
jgi:hypothetical protein